MSPAEWIVLLAGAGLIAFELWFFLGGAPSGGRRAKS
jgi:hypothetical protein